MTEAEIKAAADAMMECMFAPHELPLPADLQERYLETARAALEAAERVRGCPMPVVDAVKDAAILNAIIRGVEMDAAACTRLIDRLGHALFRTPEGSHHDESADTQG
jgi:hypothetical protein